MWADDVSLSSLVRCLPKHLQQHIQLQLTETSTYATIRSLVIAYEQTTSSWTDKRIYSEICVFTGAVTSYSTPGDAAPMELVLFSGRAKARANQKMVSLFGKAKEKEKMTLRVKASQKESLVSLMVKAKDLVRKVKP